MTPVKIIYAVSLFLLFNCDLLAQVESDYIDLFKLNQFDSIILTPENGPWREVYIYSNKKLSRRVFYDKDDDIYRETEYSRKGGLLISRHWEKDIAPGSSDPVQRNNTFEVEISKSSSDKVLQKRRFQVVGSDSVLLEQIDLKYDNVGRLINEIIQTTEPGSDPLKKSRKLTYLKSKGIQIEYTGYNGAKRFQSLELNKHGKTLRITSSDPKGKVLGREMFVYDEHDRLIEKRLAWYDELTIWSDPEAFLYEVVEKIEYNKKGFAGRVYMTYKDNPVEVRIYNYY